MTCASGQNHETIKADASGWSALSYVGLWVIGDGETLELRNCACGSTLAIQISEPTAAQAEAVV